MAPSSSSSATTSVQVALRIRPPTTQDSTSIPARFQRTVIHATSSTSVTVEPTSGTPAAAGASAAASSATAGPGAKKQVFTFDQVHEPSTTQHALFTSTAQPLISRFLEGFNCTILAYGQTSSGKTFTMTGIDLDANPSDPNNGMGIIPRAVSTIFTQARRIKEERGNNWNFSIKGSFIEIYNEDLIDLLSMDDGGRREVQIREDKDGHIIWGGLREVNVKNPSEVMTLIRKGTSIRRTNETDMNAQSSRSHAIFSLTFTQKKYTGSGAPPRSSSPLPPGGRSPSRLARPGSVYSNTGPATGSAGRVGSPTFGRPATPSFASAMGRGGGLRPSSALGHTAERSSGAADDDSGEWVTIVSKFHFVDLAGSERLKRTAAAGERIKEGISINSGLLALGNVISALGDPSRAKSHTATHVPYRDSKLTRLLQDSLGGNAHTLMIACVSPAEWNAAETVNTLKYANRARNIKNRAVVNEKEDGWDDVEWLQGTVTRLRKELKVIKSGGSISSVAGMQPQEVEGAGKKVLAQMTELQNNYEDLREKFTERTEELTRLRRELGERHRGSSSGAVSGTGKYEEIVGPVIEEYEKTISAMEAELSLNRAALRHTNEMVEEKEEELAAISERHAATELYVEELRSRVAKLTEREASTEAYVRDLEEKMRTYDETSISSSESMTDLKREVARYRDTESYSTKYIADLEARLARSDESIISLQQTVEKLERDCDRRREEVDSLQSRLEALRQDGDSWRSDLEERERKVKELELKMQEWEKIRKEAGDTRTRLGSVVDEVVSARRSLEVDLASAPSSPTKEDNDSDTLGTSEAPVINGNNGSLDVDTTDSSLEKQFVALQQTHTATLADLSSVTSKYRDALREISDLAAQIQEAKLANPSVDGIADSTDSEKVERPIIRRRMTSGRLREASEPQHSAGGRRLFFRQAASTESLHSRSLSQSQSLSQELSSVRSRKLSSSSHGTASSHSPSHSTSTLNSALGAARPNLSISLPNGSAVSPQERSALSLEKEIMRLQEVLKEREAEISALEVSLKESRGESAITPSQDGDFIPPKVNGHHAPPVTLSPKTMNQFEHIRKSMELANGHAYHDLDSGSDRNDSSVTSETDESLDRLNELMLSMAQKESHHKEVVDDLSFQLSQTRRQLDELTTLSRDQAINMSAEVEALREKHNSDLEELETVQKREAELVESLAKLEADHVAIMEELRTSHSEAMKQKQEEMDSLLSRMKGEHESAVSALREELATTSSALERAMQEHEQAFGKLKSEHEVQLRNSLQEANDALASARKEHESAMAKATEEHADVLKRKESEVSSSLQQIEEEYYNALTKLRSDHAAVLQKHNEDTATALEKLKEEHAAEMQMAEKAKDSVLSESQSSRGVALQELQDGHAAAIARKEAAHAEGLESLKAEHLRALADKDEGHDLELNKLRAAMTRKETALNEELEKRQAEHSNILSSREAEYSAQLEQLKAEHSSSLSSKESEYTAQLEKYRSDHEELLSKLREEWSVEREQLNSTLTALQGDSSGAVERVRAELDAAVQSQKEQHAALLEEISQGQETELAQLKASHEQAMKEAVAESEEKLTGLIRSHTEESLQLRSQHQQEITDLNASIVALQEQHKAQLEEIRAIGDRTVTEERDRLSAALKELEVQHSQESETLRKDNELLVQELETYRVAADEFALVREQSRQSHEQAIVQKDGTIKSFEDQLSGFKSERDELASEVARLRAELDSTRNEQSKLIQEASKRESLVEDLERHRSVLAELQENLQRVKDEKDNLQSEKNQSDSLVRELQAQIARSASPPNGRPATERNMSFSRPGLPSAKLPPPTPPPSVPPPPAPRMTQHDATFSASSQTSSVLSTSSRDSQQPESPATSIGHSSTLTAPIIEAKLSVQIEQQAKQLEEQEAMIKTLNKQLTHCESDLQTHMDLVSTLEASLGDSEKNLRKARMHATELARERDRLNTDLEALRKELTETKREVVNVRQSIVEEKQSYELRLDEERKAKERARQQLDSRMEELSKRKSKFACL